MKSLNNISVYTLTMQIFSKKQAVLTQFFRARGRLLPQRLLFLPLALLVFSGCVPGTERAQVQAPVALVGADTIHFVMNRKEIGIPGPDGYREARNIAKMRNHAANYLMPHETVYTVLERGIAHLFKRTDLTYYTGSAPNPHIAAMARAHAVIISSLPEFETETISPTIFMAIQADTQRHYGLLPADWMNRFYHAAKSAHFRDKQYVHDLGVSHTGAHSVSVVRIIKNYGAVEPARKGVTSTVAEMGSVGAFESELFSSGAYTLSIRNIVNINDACFNVYYNVPLFKMGDVEQILKENERYMQTLDASGSRRDKSDKNTDSMPDSVG